MITLTQEMIDSLELARDKAKLVDKLLDEIVNLCQPYSKEVKKIIEENQELSKDDLTMMLLRMPSHYERAELRSYYYHLHPEKNDKNPLK